MSIRIHRNLNGNASNGWVVTPKGGKSFRVPSIVVMLTGSKISAATLARIRTPKGELTSSGAKGIGKRTVGAWLLGHPLDDLGNLQPNGATVGFNSFHDDEFKVWYDGKFAPIQEGLIVRFTESGTVEVMA